MKLILKSILDVFTSIFKWVVIGALSLMISGYALLYTPSGHQVLVSLVEGTVYLFTEYRMTIGSISGDVSHSISLATLVVEDSDGGKLTVEDLKIKWHPQALLAGDLLIDRLYAARVIYQASGKPSTPSVPEIPTLPVTLIVKSVHVPFIQYLEPNNEEVVVFHMGGVLDIKSQNINLRAEGNAPYDMHLLAELAPNQKGLHANLSGHYKKLVTLDFHGDLDPENILKGKLSGTLLCAPSVLGGSGSRLLPLHIDGALDKESQLHLFIPSQGGTRILDAHIKAIRSKRYATFDGHVDLPKFFEMFDAEKKLTGNISQIDMKKSNGRLNIKGGVDYRKNYYVNTDIGLRDALLVVPDIPKLVVDGNYTLSGPWNELTLKGRTDIKDAVFVLKEFAQDDIETVEVIEDDAGEPPVQMAALLPRLDVEIHLGSHVFLEGRGLKSRLEGFLHVRGKENYDIAGEIHATKGTFTFLNHRMRIIRGAVILAESGIMVDIRTQLTLSDDTIYIRLDGSLENPKLHFSSENNLPKEEIISYMLFGKSTVTITPLQALRLASVLKSFSSADDSWNVKVMNAIRDYVPIDHIDVKVDDNDMQDSTLEVGTFVKDDVYMEVERSASGEKNALKLEMDISEALKLETSISKQEDKDKVSASLKYQY